MRAVPSIAAHMLLSIAAPKSAFSDAILIGEDPINMAPLKSFLQAYMESESKVITLSRPTIDDFEFQHPVVVITCLNRPRAIDISRLPEGSVVLDFGYSNDGSTFVGDTDWHIPGSNSSNTTVFAAPSGPNSLLSHCLLRNLYVSWKRSLLG